MILRLRTTEKTPITRARLYVEECEVALREADDYLQVCELDWAARLEGTEIAIDEARNNYEHAWWDLKEAKDRLAELLDRQSRAGGTLVAVEPAEPGLSNKEFWPRLDPIDRHPTRDPG